MLAAAHFTPEAPQDRSLLHANALADALQSERRLLEDLVMVLKQQRDGVAGNDLEAIDTSVYSAQRILLTLQQARRRRRTLLRILAGREDVGIGELEQTVGPSALTPGVREARDGLQAAARALAKELSVNRQVLHGALAVGDELIRAMVGADRPASAYTQHPDEAPAANPRGAALLDTKV